MLESRIRCFDSLDFLKWLCFATKPASFGLIECFEKTGCAGCRRRPCFLSYIDLTFVTDVADFAFVALPLLLEFLFVSIYDKLLRVSEPLVPYPHRLAAQFIFLRHYLLFQFFLDL